jgi:hypothetical protein
MSAHLDLDTFFKIQITQRDFLAAGPAEPCHLVSCWKSGFWRHQDGSHSKLPSQIVLRFWQQETIQELEILTPLPDSSVVRPDSYSKSFMSACDFPSWKARYMRACRTMNAEERRISHLRGDRLEGSKMRWGAGEIARRWLAIRGRPNPDRTSLKFKKDDR